MPSGRRPASRTAVSRRLTMSRWAATSTTCWRGPAGRVDRRRAGEVEDRVVERHRHLVLGLEAHRGGEFLVVGDRRQLERAQHRALVGDADAHALAQACVAEQLAQRLAERLLVEHLALAHRVGRQRQRAARSATIAPLTVRLHGGDEAGLDVQADDVPPERRPKLERSQLRLSDELGSWVRGGIMREGAVPDGRIAAAGGLSARNGRRFSGESD